MKLQVYFGIAIRIILLGAIGTLFSFATPALRDFWGDVPRECKNPFNVDDGWTWGARHYWYFWTTVLLFLLSLVNAIMGIARLLNKHYKI